MVHCVSISRPNILVIGGGSRIAAALDGCLLKRARWIVRRECGRSNEIRVANYGAIPSTTFEGIDCVVNCVGVSEGGRAHLHHVNVDLATRIAAAAKAMGVARFVHISSFSVYGGAAFINSTTKEAPVSDYGRSKLDADTALAEMSSANFDVVLLRLPLIYATGAVGGLGKLGTLLRFWRRVRIWLVPVGDISRAMIGVELSAEVIARLIADRRTGIVFAADPKPFTYSGVMKARSRDRLRRLPVPRMVAATLARAIPGFGVQLFADSRLSEADNLAIEYGLASRLERDIATAELD